MLPKYQLIADHLRAHLAGDGKARLTRLPTEAQLCERYQVSRQTVRQALALLESEGLIKRRQGSGAYATGLHPNPSHNQIAVLLPSDSDYTYAHLQNELRLDLEQEGFSVSFYLTGHSVFTERALLLQLLELPLRGLIIDPVKNALPSPNLDLYERLLSRHIPCVFLHTPYEGIPTHQSITEDNTGGGVQLAQYFLSGGHRRIGAILRSDTREGLERYRGITTACAKEGVLPEDPMIYWYDTQTLLALQKERATGFLKDFIQKNIPGCSAVICQDDEIAYWLVKELMRAGFHVPQDVSVAGFDNSFLCNFSTPTLTSLALQGSLASLSAGALLALLRGETVTSRKLTYELFIRDSSIALY